MRFHQIQTILSLCVFAAVSVGETVATAASNTPPIYKPPRISFSDLRSNSNGEDESHKLLSDILSNVGIVSIKDIPNYTNERVNALKAMHKCLAVSDVDDETTTKVHQSHTFEDGTTRDTFATHTVPGPGGMQKLFKTNVSVPEECQEFEKASRALRQTISSVTQAFASKLGSIMDDDSTNTIPRLVTEDGSYTFNTIEDIVENGEHLEHFHCYKHQGGSFDNEEEEEEKETIEFHTDQGLFITFTPAMMIGDNEENNPGRSGFFIQLNDGTQSVVDFEVDDLIFMLGDGVNQYVNKETSGHALSLRATPHALKMPKAMHENSVRVWHGRMVLPPSGAIHPTHGKTFGELRELMIQESLSSEENKYLNVGCSSPSNAARILEETTCEAGTIFCWHRCMAANTTEVSPDVCSASNLQLQCVNPRDQVWVDDHGDYFPACTNSTELATPYPKLPAENHYPRDEETCGTDEAFAVFATTEGYDHSIDFPTSKFMWSIVNDGTEVHGKIAFNGLFGFLGVGLAGPEGSMKNGMHNARIILGLPGGDYDAGTGLDLTMDDTVDEYVIHPTMNYFRFWQTPYYAMSADNAAEAPESVSGNTTTAPVTALARSGNGNNANTYTVVSTECYTSLEFTAKSISGQDFNLTGIDEMLWAANSEDYFVGYHGTNRARFTVNWATGEASLYNPYALPPGDEETDEAEEAGEAEEAHSEHEDDHDDHDHEHEHEESMSNSFTITPVVSGVITSIFASFIYVLM